MPLFAQSAIELTELTPAPDWAIAERALLDEASEAAGIFYNRYVDERGYLKCIDTCCYGGGWLTALDITSGQLWQANQVGETRSSLSSSQQSASVKER